MSQALSELLSRKEMACQITHFLKKRRTPARAYSAPRFESGIEPSTDKHSIRGTRQREPTSRRPVWKWLYKLIEFDPLTFLVVIPKHEKPKPLFSALHGEEYLGRVPHYMRDAHVEGKRPAAQRTVSRPLFQVSGALSAMVGISL